ncbi:MAG: hypothetical protein J7K21_02445 [Desulfurococcales archaeon]|nr:hypothetical protein [Desulfurococcales archaeon]
MSSSTIDADTLKQFLGKAIQQYNKHHAPEAIARIIGIRSNKEAIIEFKGSFCNTCGIRDWLEDLAYILEDLGIEAKLKEMIEPGG